MQGQALQQSVPGPRSQPVSLSSFLVYLSVFLMDPQRLSQGKTYHNLFTILSIGRENLYVPFLILKSLQRMFFCCCCCWRGETYFGVFV